MPSIVVGELADLRPEEPEYSLKYSWSINCGSTNIFCDLLIKTGSEQDFERLAPFDPDQIDEECDELDFF